MENIQAKVWAVVVVVLLLAAAAAAWLINHSLIKHGLSPEERLFYLPHGLLIHRALILQS